MSHAYLLWVATLIYGVHMLEETIYNWHDWVRTLLKVDAEWSEFYMVNAIVIRGLRWELSDPIEEC